MDANATWILVKSQRSQEKGEPEGEFCMVSNLIFSASYYLIFKQIKCTTFQYNIINISWSYTNFILLKVIEKFHDQILMK